MIKNKLILALLAVLLVIKFLYVPWYDWVQDQNQSIQQLTAFKAKQDQAIANTSTLKHQLEKANQSIEQFKKLAPILKQNEKSNTLWFSLIDSLKRKELKIYNQKIEFEETVTSQLGYVTGSLVISGNAPHVIDAILKLEQQSPIAFLDKVNVNRKGKGDIDTMVAQLFVGYWFSHERAATL